MASVANFQTRFTEFCDIDDDRVQLFLDDAALFMGEPTRWGKVFDVAHQYHAAHLLVVSIATESGETGILAPTSHQEVDDVVIKNAIGASQPTFDDLLSTSYGKRYWTYRKMRFAGPIGV